MEDRNPGDDRGELFEIAYQELRAIASRLMRDQRGGHTLQTTALVHEAYLNLMKRGSGQWDDRVRFLGVAAKAMRNILVDHARRRLADKRGGVDRRRVTLSGRISSSTAPEYDVLDLHAALLRLEEVDPDAAVVAELRLFAGLTTPECAEHLGVSTRTVEREWRVAKASLSEFLGSEDDG